MATIGKIRERSGLVIAVIGLAMLGFIATDLFSNNSMFRGDNGPTSIGTIYGEDIDPGQFHSLYETALNNRRMQMGAEASLSPALEGAMNDEVWQQVISERILEKETADLGLEVTGEEIMELFLGDRPHPVAQQVFGDPQTGQIDKQRAYQIITTINTQTPEAQQQWKGIEDYLSRERLKEKYFSMVRNAMFVTDLEAREDFYARNKTASIQFVPLFLNAISDSSVKLTDAEMQKYYNTNKEQYKREDGRSIEYVTFDINATAEDTSAAQKWINQQVEAFRKTKNDSSFVARVGRTAFENKYLPRGSYPANIEEQIFSADSGTIIGPYFEEGSYKIAKVMGSKADTVNYYKASHILIRPNGATPEDSSEANKKARELLAKIKAGADFSQMASENSQDPSNAGKGGDLGWFRDGQMVSKFNNAVKNGKKGDVVMVQTEFGTHIIKITENKSNKLVKAGIIERAVYAGNTTQDKAYTQASKFRNAAQTGADFTKAASGMKLTKRVAENLKPNDRSIAGLDNPRELIRWAYSPETKVGDVSEPKVIGNKYVIAHLTAANEAGYTPFEDVKDQVKVFAIREKKKELLEEKMRKAMEGVSSLEAIAKNVESTVSSAESVNFQNPFIPNLSNEPALAGTVFGLKQNKLSQPVKGENGVYVVKVVSFNEIKAPEKFDTERKMMAMQYSSQVQELAMEALRKKADIKDNRYIYY